MNKHPTIRHGPALDAGAQRAGPLAGESLNTDVIGGVWVQSLDGQVCFRGVAVVVLLVVYVFVHHPVVSYLAVPFLQVRRLPGELRARLGETRHL